MYKRLVSVLVFAASIWYLQGSALAVIEKIPPQGYKHLDGVRIALVYPGESRVKPVFAKDIPPSDKPHYEVVEVLTPLELKITQGTLQLSEKSSSSGIGCSGIATAASCGFVGGSKIVSKVNNSHLLYIRWVPGKENMAEPKEGISLYFVHETSMFGEAYGIGVKVAGSAKAWAKANTYDPNDLISGLYGRKCPLLLTYDFVSKSDVRTTSMPNLRSGWTGYIVIEIEAGAQSLLYGAAGSQAEAKISWQAECPKGGK